MMGKQLERTYHLQLLVLMMEFLVSFCGFQIFYNEKIVLTF